MKDFRGAKLTGVTYIGEDFSGADFSGAELVNVVFCKCNFRGADFSGLRLENTCFEKCLFDVVEEGGFWSTVELAQFYKANIRIKYNTPRTDNIMNLIYNNCYENYTILSSDIFCPVDTVGQELIVYKKIHVDANFIIYGNAVAKLRIPADAERIIYKGDKCRASCAQVLEIKDGLENSYDIGCSAFYPIVQEYKVGSMIYADSFDSNPLTVCSSGIHFFLTEEEAWDYRG